MKELGEMGGCTTKARSSPKMDTSIQADGTQCMHFAFTLSNIIPRHKCGFGTIETSSIPAKSSAWLEVDGQIVTYDKFNFWENTVCNRGYSTSHKVPQGLTRA